MKKYKVNCYRATMLIIHEDSTIRSAAAAYNISKSKLHNYIHKEFKRIYPLKYKQLKRILQHHFNTKHINAGNVIKLKREVLKNAQNTI
jgi:hypothetical protein